MVEQMYFSNPAGKDFHYLRYLPKDYDPAQKYPLVVFLHGYGECGPEDGSDMEQLFHYFWFGRARDGEDFPCIMVAPQCQKEHYWGSYIESLNRFLDAVIEENAVDTARVYLTGLSMGGTGTWLWGLGNPERFAAIAPVCGTGVCWFGFMLKDTPVWAFHGDQDDIVPVDESVRMVSKVVANGGNAKLTLLHGVGHDAWVEAYKGRTLLDWLLSHHL